MWAWDKTEHVEIIALISTNTSAQCLLQRIYSRCHEEQSEHFLNFLLSTYTLKRRQEEKLAALRSRRDNNRVRQSLDALKRAAEGTENTMPFILDSVRQYATLGEICDAFREVFGVYQETAHL